jgi:hypothetical protein
VSPRLHRDYIEVTDVAHYFAVSVVSKTQRLCARYHEATAKGLHVD